MANTHPVIAKWFKDPEFNKLPEEKKVTAIGNWFDGNLATEDFYKAPLNDQVKSRENFITAHMLQKKTEGPKKGSTLGAFAQTLSRVPENLAAKTIMAVQGQEGASVADRGIADRFVNFVEERNRKLSEEYKGTGDVIPGVISKQDVADLGGNLAFSGVSMGGTIGGGAAGGAIGGLAGGVGAPVGAVAGGMAGGAAAAYRMDSYQVMNDWLEKANKESIAKGAGPISKEEEEKFKSEMSDLATKHGLWEAGPEGVGNVLELALMTAKNLPGVRWVPKKLVGKAVKGGLRAAGIVGTEATTETATQMGQHNTEVEAGMTQEPKREWTSGDDLLKSVKEVLPQVLLLSGVMGAGGAAYRKAASMDVQDTPNTPEGQPETGHVVSNEVHALVNGLREQIASGRMSIADVEGVKDKAPELKQQINEAVSAGVAERLMKQFDMSQYGLTDELTGPTQEQAEWQPGTVVEQEPMDRLKVKLSGRKIGKDAKFTPEGGESEVDAAQVFEDEAGKEKHLRQSPIGAEGLNKQLSKEERKDKPRSGGEVETLEEGVPGGKVKPSIEKDLPTPENKAPEPPTKPVIEPSVDEKGKEGAGVAPGEDVDSEGVGATKEPTQEDEKYSSKLPSDKYGIYKTNINGNVKYAVRENMDNDRGFGDSIYNSEKDAEEYVAMSKKRDAANAKFREKQNIEQAKIDKAEKEQALKREDIDGFGDDLKPLQKGKALLTLNKTKRFNGKPMTVKDKIREMVANGEAETTSYETNKIKPMSRRAYNRASNEEQEAHERKIKKGGKKTIYTVGGYELGKTAYDYANFLNAKSSKSRFDTPTPKKVKEPWEMGRDEWNAAIRFFRSGKHKNAELPGGQKVILKKTSTKGNFLEDSKDFLDTLRQGAIKQALKDGKPVPPSVLKEYPDLQPSPGVGKGERSTQLTRARSIPKNIDTLESSIKERHGESISKLNLEEGATYIKVHDIEVKPNDRKAGIGASVLGEIKGYADKAGKPVVLIAEPGKGKKTALERFYKSGGFKKPGRTRDYSLPRHTHIYIPKGVETQQSKSTLPKEDPQARKDISQRHNVPPESLEYHAPWHFNGKTLHLYNVIQEGHPRHGSTLAYDPTTKDTHYVKGDEKGKPQPLQADPERLEQLRKDVYGWLKEVLPRSILKNRIAVELSPNISKEGKDVSESDRQWSEIKDPGAIMGAATVDKLNAFIELSYNFDNETIKRNTFHESFHISARWLLPEQDYRTVMDHFGNNEEKAAEAFADFALRKKGKPQPSFIYKVFRKLRMIFKRVRNGLQGQGFKSHEDVFNNLWNKGYDLLPEKVRGERVDAGKATPSQAQKMAQKWFSQMEQFLKQKLPGSGTGVNLKNMLRTWAKKGNFKQEELEWSGVLEWLTGKEKVKKADVLAYLKENNVQVQEVEKGESEFKDDGRDKVYLEFVETDEETDADIYSVHAENGNRLYTGEKQQAKWWAEDEGYQLFDSDYELARFVNDASRQENEGVKYSQYQVPGGENYRELLLTLPMPSDHEMESHSEKITGKPFDDISYKDLTEAGASDELLDRFSRNAKDRNQQRYQSSHWDEPNVVSHIRFNERTGPDGERILFVEEVQSDWMQQGRKEGFKGTLSEKEKAKINQELTKINDQRDVAYQEKDAEKLKELENKSTELNKKLLGDMQGVPNAPFKKTWPILAMKRMVRYAAENGFDSISWTPGEVQAERYDLSKHIKEINYEQASDGSNEYDFQAIDHNGQEVITEEDITIERIEELAGKEIADKIQKGEGRDDSSAYRNWKSLSGLNLKVGGEGMKGFYDKILPAAVNKFFGKKAWGKAKVGTSEVMTADRSEADRMLKSGEIENIDEMTHQEVWTLPITDKMREKAIYGGMPMFTRADKPLTKSPQPDKDKPMTSKGPGKPTTETSVNPEGGNPFKDSVVQDVVYHSGSFRVDEGDEFHIDSDSEGIHFGTEDAAMARIGGKAADDALQEIEVYHDDDGTWGYEIEGIEYGSGFDTEGEAYDDAEEMARSTDPGDDSYDEENLTHAYIEINNPAFMNDQGMGWSDAIEDAKKDGHDGIIYTNQFEDKGSDSYIVFSPGQIKILPNQSRPSSKEGQPSTQLTVMGEQINDDTLNIPSVIKEKFGRDTKPIKTVYDESVRAIKSKEFWDMIATKTVDRLHPIKTKLNERAYRLHRAETGSQATMAMFLRHGKLQWDKEDAVFRIDEKGQGVLPFLKSLGTDWRKFLYWTAAKRAVILESENRERWLDDETRDEIFKWAGGEHNEKWEKAAKELQGFNDNVLDIAEKAGLIDPESRRKWSREYYIPFYRILEDEEQRHIFLTKPDKLSSQIKQLKGADMKLGDPLENMLKNWMHLIHESMRNVARAEAFDFAINSGSQLVEPIKESKLNIYRNSKDGNMVYVTKNQDNVLMFQRNGKPVYFTVNDSELFNALSHLRVEQFDNFLMKTMRGAKKALTFGATFGPGFRIANLLRDTLHTAMIAKSFTPFMDTARGFTKAWKEDPDYIAFMASGYGFGSSYVRADNPKEAAKYVERILKKEGPEAKKRILDTPKKMLDFWEKVGSASENAARVQLYKNMLEGEGKTHFESAFAARDLLDFTMRGEAGIVNFLIQVVPFLNARMQGLYKLGRAVHNKDTRKNFLLRGSMLTAASIALWLLTGDRDEYKELEDWDKWSYYHFWIGDLHFRIPKPFEVGAIFSSFPVAMMDAMSQNEEGRHIAEFMAYTAKETFALGTPQLFQPVIEQWANKTSYTGRPIVGQALQGLKPSEQKEPWTSETAQLAGKLGISPKRAEALVQGYFSTFGMFILGLSDVALHNVLEYPEDPTMKIDHMPAIGRFVKQSNPATHTKYQTWFYDMFKDIDETVKTVNHYRRTGQAEKAVELAKEDYKKLSYRKGFIRIRRKITAINKQIKAILLHSGMTSEEKAKSIDQLIKTKNTILRAVHDQVKKAKER